MSAITQLILSIPCDKGAGRIITVTYPDNVECFSCGRIAADGTPITEVYLLDESFFEMSGTRCSSQPCEYDVEGCSFSVTW